MTLAELTKMLDLSADEVWALVVKGSKKNVERSKPDIAEDIWQRAVTTYIDQLKNFAEAAKKNGRSTEEYLGKMVRGLQQSVDVLEKELKAAEEMRSYWFQKYMETDKDFRKGVKDGEKLFKQRTEVSLEDRIDLLEAKFREARFTPAIPFPNWQWMPSIQTGSST